MKETKEERMTIQFYVPGEEKKEAPKLYVTKTSRRPKTGSRGGHDPFGTARLYISPEGENLLGNLMNRRCRPVELYRTVLPEIFEKFNIHPSSVRWSQKAGCSCGCSPGFILHGVRGEEFWADVTETAPKSALALMA
jgi:hypothetical protein